MTGKYGSLCRSVRYRLLCWIIFWEFLPDFSLLFQTKETEYRKRGILRGKGVKYGKQDYVRRCPRH